jgi:hypothetical protein
MSTNYTLTVHNDSLRFGNICVYTTSPASEKLHNDLVSLAWFSKAAHPQTSVCFEWALDYSFMWSETGTLEPGVKFVASENWGADPSSAHECSVRLDKQSGAYLFETAQAPKEPLSGTLDVKTTNNVPHNEAAVGIGIGGSPALIVPATPNYNFTFIPHIKYWVAFGTFAEGEVLDLNSMASEVKEVVFNPNEYDKHITLNARNLWEES